jgi:transcription termination factor Rho
MSILDRAALEESPLADLHLIASELTLDGYRRLRKSELIDAILERQGGDASGGKASASEDRPPADDGEKPKRRAPRARAKAAPADEEPTREGTEEPTREETEDRTEERTEERADGEEPPATRRRRGRRGGRGRTAAREEAEPAGEESKAEEQAEPEPSAEEPLVEGIVELLPNGSGFLRVSPPDPSDEDVYISAAQVKRCELIVGDRISGPRRAPRRSERFSSLVRIDTINGQPASEVAEGARFDDLPAAFPEERFRLGSEDPTVKAIEWLTPFGKGSRVTIAGPARAGKSEALRRLASALNGHEDVQLLVALAGIRPEEISEWQKGPIEPTAAASIAASTDAQANTIERVIDQARRVAARGGDVVVLIDSLDGIEPLAARKALAAARNLVDGGSLTVIATATTPLGGETTVIALDARLASTGRFPALDLTASGTIRPELLVGEAGAEAIARARAEALDQ